VGCGPQRTGQVSAGKRLAVGLVGCALFVGFGILLSVLFPLLMRAALGN